MSVIFRLNKDLLIIIRKREIDSVLKWTAKVDIFKTSYIVVPINES